MLVFPYNFIYLSIYFVFGCAGSSWLAGFSLVADSRVYSCCGVQTSHCGGFSCSGAWVLGCAGFSCGTWASLLRGMWNLPRPGIKPMSPASADGFFTTEPPGKLCHSILNSTDSGQGIHFRAKISGLVWPCLWKSLVLPYSPSFWNM